MSAMRLELPRTAAGRLLALLIAVAPAVAGVLPGAAVTSAAGARAKSAAAIPLMGVNVSNVDIASPSGASRPT